MCTYTADAKIEKRIVRAGPPLPETLRLLSPLAPTLEKLNLSSNKLGGTMTGDIMVFTKLTELGLADMSLEGESRVGCAIRPRRSKSRRKSKFAYMNDNHLAHVLAQTLYRLNSASSRTCRNSGWAATCSQVQDHQLCRRSQIQHSRL